MGQRSYNFDALLQLADGAAAYTASGIGQVGGASKICDLGGSPTGNNFSALGLVGGTARIDAVAIIDITAITTVTDGNYRLSIMGSNNANGSLPVELAGQDVGLGSGIPNGSAAGTDVLGTGSTTTPGLREILFSTEQNGINYEFAYLYVSVLGSTSKSISLTAFISALQKE